MTFSFKILEIIQNISVFLLKYKNNIEKKTCTYDSTIFCLMSSRKSYSFACLLEKLGDLPITHSSVSETSSAFIESFSEITLRPTRSVNWSMCLLPLYGFVGTVQHQALVLAPDRPRTNHRIQHLVFSWAL